MRQGTRLCLLFSKQTTANAHQNKAKTMCPKTALYPDPDQKTQPERKSRTPQKLIVSAHKNTPLHNSMQGGVLF